MEPAQVQELLAASGLSAPRSAVAATADEAVAKASAMEGPVVLKVISESALHKSDVGGVELGVEGDDGVRTAFEILLLRTTR